jgi:hypothetical protein
MFLRSGNNALIGRYIAAFIATLYFGYYALTSTEWHFIDNANLIIHEAGHVVFMFFGDFLHILGGSLLQVVFPLVFAGYFFFRKDLFSASLVLFWVGQNLINVSVYAGDAIVMQLPLLGGDTVMHDWNTLLSMMGLLKYTPQVSEALYVAGIMVCTIAAIGAFRYAARPNPHLRPEML